MPCLPSSLRRSMAFVLLVGFTLAGYAQTQKTVQTKTLNSSTIRFEDATASAKIQFEHAISAEKKYLIESMSGGVLLLDYDQDGWLDIYFTNAPGVEQAKR